MKLAWPFYIVADCSGSMRFKHNAYSPTAYDAMLEGIHSLIDVADERIDVADLAHISIITFSDKAEVALPLSSMHSGFVLPQNLVKGKYTNFRDAFELLSSTIASDIQSLQANGYQLKKPIVFFITDGKPEENGIPQHESEWLPPLTALKELEVPVRGRRGNISQEKVVIVSMGFDDADEDNLLKIAQFPGIACLAERGVAAPDVLMGRVLDAILDSISVSAAQGSFDFKLPEGMRKLS